MESVKKKQCLILLCKEQVWFLRVMTIEKPCPKIQYSNEEIHLLQ